MEGSDPEIGLEYDITGQVLYSENLPDIYIFREGDDILSTYWILNEEEINLGETNYSMYGYPIEDINEIEAYIPKRLQKKFHTLSKKFINLLFKY